MRKQVIQLFILAIMALAFINLESDCQNRKDCERQPEPAPTLSQPNPALGWSVADFGSAEDPLAAFNRFPLDKPFRIPPEGEYLSADRDSPHYGLDYTDMDARSLGQTKAVYALGPGIVTTLNPCMPCWAEGKPGTGQIRSLLPRYNSGFGAIVLIEHPYNDRVSFYTLYAHLDTIRVNVGRKVEAGTQIATMGATGEVAAAHVHLELRYGPPGAFWGADFSSQVDVDRWVAIPFDSPAFLLYPEHHIPFIRVLEKWIKKNRSSAAH